MTHDTSASQAGITPQWLSLHGPYLAPIANDFLQRHMYRCFCYSNIVVNCTRRKADFPPRSNQAPLHVRLKRRVGEKQRRVPEQMTLSAILPIKEFSQCNCATDRKIPGLNALPDSAVGVAILIAIAGRNCNIHLRTHRLYTAQTCKKLA